MVPTILASSQSYRLYCSLLSLDQGWSLGPVAYSRSDRNSVWRLEYKRHRDFCLVVLFLLDHLLWGKTATRCTTVWGGRCANSQVGATVSANSHVSESLWKKSSSPSLAFTWDCNPPDCLTATSWETLSQNHPTKLLPGIPDPQKLGKRISVRNWVLGIICYAAIDN